MAFATYLYQEMFEQPTNLSWINKNQNTTQTILFIKPVQKENRIQKEKKQKQITKKLWIFILFL